MHRVWCGVRGRAGGMALYGCPIRKVPGYGPTLRVFGTHRLKVRLEWLVVFPDGRLVGALMHEQRIGVWTGTEWDTYRI